MNKKTPHAAIVDWLIRRAQRTPYFHLPGYMQRWWLWRSSILRVRIHHILRSDSGRDMHDHPWNYVSLILKGGYWEVTRGPEGTERRCWHGPGSLVIHRAAFTHRLELPEGSSAWTLFVHGRKKQEWGFHTCLGKIHWRDYGARITGAGPDD